MKGRMELCIFLATLPLELPLLCCNFKAFQRSLEPDIILPVVKVLLPLPLFMWWFCPSCPSRGRFDSAFGGNL
jgi:hypothetical protein